MSTNRTAFRGLIAASLWLCASFNHASEADEMPSPGRRPVLIQMTWLNSRVGLALFTAKRKLGSESFADLARSYPRFAAAILIHEQLHALGLGENPPSSQEITLRVLERCGS